QRTRALQVGTAALAGDDAGRVRAGARLAFLRAVRLRGLHPRPSRDGRDSRLAELHGHADGMEAGSGVCEAVASPDQLPASSFQLPATSFQLPAELQAGR